MARSELSGVRLAELVGTMSLAVDLGLGQPMGHVARSCVIASRLGDRMGLSQAERAALFYVTLLGWVGCIADSHESAAWFGDDIAYRADVYDLDMKPLPFLGYLLRRAGAGQPATHRVGKQAMILATGARGVQDSLRAHCQVTTTVARRLGLGSDVTEPLQQIYARWDGKGLPRGVGGEGITLLVRLWHVADVGEVHERRGGVTAAVDVARARSGGQFDPAVVDAFCAGADELFDDLADTTAWQDMVGAEPSLQPAMSEPELDSALEAVADWVDTKSPCFGGHSRGVAELAAAAARRVGMEDREVRVVRRAGLGHDLGRTGVSNNIWDKPGALTDSESERVRLHSYYTERMLARPEALAEVGRIAAMAHERLDGSGYHRGLSATGIPMAGRLLAAADTYHTKLEPRPHREALPADDAAKLLHEEAKAGRLDPVAVDAVLACAGHRAGRPATGPAGLTPREVQVLALLARGASNRQIARELRIAPKTAGNHIERIYVKTGVTSRAAATLFAFEHGLLSPLDPIG
ncbi:MAG TPA: HD domain-containing phosphohydrolase [Nocardioidaceae bacterium]|nr:HD domain-containing phosphohydrolase [Nocardioidaceae bacterium]